MKFRITEKIAISCLIIFQLILITPKIAHGSAPLPESPSITHMAKISDLIFTGKVIDINKDENYTYYKFEIYEYIKNPQNTTTFTLQIRGGLTGYTKPNAASFEKDQEYLVFVIPENTRYIVAYGDYGKIQLSKISPETLDNLRYIYDPLNTIIFQDLTITPEEINNGENVTILFKITSKENQESTVGFIIEHHPPPYQIIDEEKLTLKYFQIAKSISIPARRTISYEYILESNYTGVNTIEINYQGSPILINTFKVIESNKTNNDSDLTLVHYLPVFIVIGIISLGALLQIMYPSKNR